MAKVSFVRQYPKAEEDYLDHYQCTYPKTHPADQVKICGSKPARPVFPVGSDPRGFPVLGLCRDHDTSVEPTHVGWSPDDQ